MGFLLVSCSGHSKQDEAEAPRQSFHQANSYSSTKGVVNGKTLIKSKQPITKIDTGVTYLILTPTAGDSVWIYFKVIDGSHYITLSDLAHMPRSYYKKVGDDKTITITESLYRQEGESIHGTSNQKQMILSFDYKT